MFNMIPRSVNRSLFDAFADDFFSPVYGRMIEQVRPMRVDVRDEGEHFLLEAEMPGVEKENLHVTVKDGMLTIAAAYGNEKEDKQEGRYVCRERRCGSMSRSFGLDGIAEDGIAAEFKNGILTLTLPKAAPVQEPEARSIEIH